MNESAELPDLEGVPEWARKIVERSARRTSAPPSVLDYRGQKAWPLLIGAATVASFLPRELVPHSLSGEERREAEHAVLRFAEPSYEPEGTKWSLIGDARQAVLTAIEPSEVPAETPNHDPLTDALRECLRGKRKKGYQSSDLRALEATRLAVTWLGGASHLDLPELEDLDRQIELRRLLSPFEHMIGRQPATGTAPPAHRFFGRAKEMNSLRDYVGAAGVSSLAARAAAAVVSVFKSRAPMTVWGTGGVGKTTLIAKFMLEHAEAAKMRFPFAYLDFDRSTISARNQLGLLAEMCQQVGAQFPELTAPMTALRGQLTPLILKFENSPDEPTSLVHSYAQEFRQHVDQYLVQSETLFEWARPFLLVFDTFEVVQYGPDQVIGLEHFVRSFSRPQDSGMWPRLRLIISGRKKIAEFIVKAEELQLGALDRDGSAEMLMAFATDAGKPVDKKNALRLVHAIATAVGDKRATGVRPLHLRLIGDVFKDERTSDASGAAIVDSLVEELSGKSALTKDGLAGDTFVNGVLVRRILDHVKDRRVKALADPGLVVRRITAKVIAEVMTRGTWDPDKTIGDPGDVAPSKLWEVDDEIAAEIFEAFKCEVSLVEPDDRDPKNALRHRQDVRNDMLPLIRARRRQSFVRLHELAYKHFSEHAAQDPASKTEALYHALWLDLPFATLDRFWTDDARIDPEEFDEGSRASIYLKAKSKKGRGTLSAEEVAQLPADMGVEWLASRAEELLRKRRLEESLKSVRAAAGSDYARIDDKPELAAVTARLLYRSGLWHECALLLQRHLTFEMLADLQWTRDASAEMNAYVSLIRTWATMAGRSGAPVEEIDTIFRLAVSLRGPFARMEACAHLELGLRQHEATEIVQTRREELRFTIRETAGGIPARQWPDEGRTLRLAILAAELDDTGRLFAYVDLTEKLPRDPEVVRHFLSINEKIMRSDAVKLLGDLRTSREIGDAIDRIWRKQKHDIMKGVSEGEIGADLLTIMAYDQSDWTQALGNALTRSLKTDVRPVTRAFHDVAELPDVKRALHRHDGTSLVQLAMDDGRFLDIVRRLSDLPEQQEPAHDLIAPDERDVPWRYPDTTPAIATALLRWHRVALRKTAQSEGGSQSEKQPERGV